jgi:hypothetical protein
MNIKIRQSDLSLELSLTSEEAKQVVDSLWNDFNWQNTGAPDFYRTLHEVLYVALGGSAMTTEIPRVQE